MVMRYVIGLWFLCAFGMAVLWAGCEETVCTLVGCTDGVDVELVPEIDATYDVTLILDGEAGAFTCELADEVGGWTLLDAMGATNVEFCTGSGFLLRGTPESVEITVDAQDGSWSGSLMESPTYEVLQPNGPDCPPTCRVARVAIANEVTGHEP